jgi:glycosyltransferase involved in cell wall biosynthesis
MSGCGVEPMRIAINAVNANENLRGPDRYATELLKSLTSIDQRNSYLVFYAPWQGWYPEMLKAPNVHLVLLNPPRSPYLRIIWQALALPRILNKYHPDVVHLPNTIFMRRHKHRVIITIHDLAEFTFPEKLNTFRAYVRRILARAAARSADRIIAVSNYTKNEIRRILGIDSEKVRVVWEGVSIANHNGADCDHVRRKYGLTSDYLLYVGEIEKTKNIEGVIRAFAKSEKGIRDRCKLVLAGHAGNAYEDIIALIRNNKLKEKVLYLGYVKDEELSCLYRGTKAFIFPSLVEGFGLVVLEAMAYGAPVIASNAGALPEVVGDAALLVDPYNDMAIRDAITRIVSDDAFRRDLINRGNKRVQEFSWTRTATDMLNIYDEVCRGLPRQ